jgi:phage shock protein A
MTSNVESSNRSIASFERYENMANQKLDKAAAMAELNRGTEEAGIKDLTRKYSAGADVDAELEALKASLGQTTSAE